MRNDDEDEDEKTPAAPKEASPSAMLIQKKFLEQRKIFLWGGVDDASAKDIVEKLLFLESDAPGKEIIFYVSTPGGSITAGMAVYDTIRLITSPVKVIVTGMAASMGSILLQAPKKKGNRLLFPHARVMIHQPLIMGRIQAPAVDIHIQAQEMERIRSELNEILAKASKQKLEKVIKDTDRDFYMTAEEAIEYGLADGIVTEL
ncbi:MAG: ATP-dependent Clp protease proteolytic subunit [Verrucomicrobia bacterium]|jgi:ATP-dependent Clp protease protease subunit|nr:ATP-dependent Clp protease proteolytic subunit [Verrucomicrobiota bacterium]NBR42889.1 ATP-dependent Clp protease proteolytic subunit [Verrucomicrobiota bacterium]NBS05458.1 ATP-dependent Clp protease proteolytic subunit [Verrucomicrobiota bacterium]NBY37661.1 ATP-dependent Clp protease proteolytic subunit [Verrucomicrobiota bacterium]TSA35584.1 MAG: ATP-dependent Clp protease proteolytic subunit [Opitutales bacterium]